MWWWILVARELESHPARHPATVLDQVQFRNYQYTLQPYFIPNMKNTSLFKKQQQHSRMPALLMVCCHQVGHGGILRVVRIFHHSGSEKSSVCARDMFE